MNWRTVGTLKIRKRPVIGVVDERCVIVNIFFFFSC